MNARSVRTKKTMWVLAFFSGRVPPHRAPKTHEKAAPKGKQRWAGHLTAAVRHDRGAPACGVPGALVTLVFIACSMGLLDFYSLQHLGCCRDLRRVCLGNLELYSRSRAILLIAACALLACCSMVVDCVFGRFPIVFAWIFNSFSNVAQCILI